MNPSRLLRLVGALILIGLLVLAASGCSASKSTTEIGNAVCRNTTKELQAQAGKDDEQSYVQMLIIHQREAKALGRLDDDRIKVLAILEAGIADYVSKTISGAPSEIGLPEDWQDSLHKGFQVAGLDDCAERGSEYPGRGLDGAADIPVGTAPPADAAAPDMLNQDPSQIELPSSGALFSYPGLEQPEPITIDAG